MVNVIERKRMSPAQVLQVGAIAIRAIRRIREHIEAAKHPDSPQGSKVTPAEAMGAVVLGLLDAAPRVYEVVTGEEAPDVDIAEVLGGPDA